MKHKTRTKALSWLLSLVMVLSLVPGMSLTALAESTHTHEGWTAWTATDNLPTAAGSYYLTNNVTLTSTWEAPTDTVNLCLDGHSITMTGSTGSVISIGTGATLNLYDKDDNLGVITGGKDSGVSVSGAFTMYGGNITNNTSTWNADAYEGGTGGGVYVDKTGTFTMCGGSVTNNRAVGLSNQWGDFGGAGGGVYVGGMFTMNGGSITGNQADFSGGGVCVAGGNSYTDDYNPLVPAAVMKLSGNVEIINNTKGATTQVASNVFLGKDSNSSHDPNYDAKIIITAAMTNSSPIGVTMALPGVFTQDSTNELKASDYIGSFTSDDSDCSVQADGNELKLGFTVWNGEGTEESPYLISSVDDLKALAGEANRGRISQDAHFKLTTDMDLGGSENNQWTPIGIDENHFFSGTFDGDFHTIRGLYINSDGYGCGLFGYVIQATIKNLAVAGSVTSTGNNLGGIVGLSSGKELSSILYCTSDVTVSSTGERGQFVGGIAGSFWGTISKCYNTGSVTGKNMVGGVAGYVDHSYTTAEKSKVEDCYNAGKITGGSGENNYGIGGVVGYNSSNGESHGVVSRCYNSGEVVGNNAGAVVGWRDSTSSIYSEVEKCYYLAGSAGANCKGIGHDDEQDGSSSDHGTTALQESGFKTTTPFTDWSSDVWYFSDSDYPRLKYPATVDTAPTAKTLSHNGTAQALITAGVASGGTMRYAIGVNGTTAPASGWGTDTPTATDAGTYYVWYKAVGDAAHSDSKAECITVTITDKAIQTITADDVTATYGDTDKSVSASVTTPASGGGEISYAVKSGSEDYIDVNASTGALTIKKAGTATVTVTAAETDDYAAATKDVTVTVNKKAVTVKADDKRITVGAEVPELTKTVTGLVGNDQEGILTVSLECEYDADTPGTYPITVTGDAEQGNYTVTYEGGTLTISRRPSPSSPSTPTTTVTVTVSGDDETVNVTVRVSGDTATITSADVDKVLEAEDVGTVTIDVSALKQDVTEVVIPGAMVDKIADAVADESNNADCLEIKLPTGAVTFDAEAVAAISEQANGKDLRLNLEDIGENRLKAAQKSAVEDMNVQEVLDAYMTANGQRISDFKGGKATVTVSYELKDGQTGRGVVVWYVAEDGEKTEVPTAYNDKTVSFTVEHFSNYVIAYDAERAAACPKDDTCPISAFSDASATAWYHDGIHFCLENGMMNGVGGNKFDPNGTTSRAMIVTILYRLEGEPEVTAENPFDDVKADTWYTDAVIWAAENEIVSGYGGGKFGPNDNITREQLATILYRYAQSKGQGFEGSWMFLLDYPDASEISDWADEAMHWMVMNGVINGKDGKLVPKGDASRAEAATMLQRFCENVAE